MVYILVFLSSERPPPIPQSPQSSPAHPNAASPSVILVILVISLSEKLLININRKLNNKTNAVFISIKLIQYYSDISKFFIYCEFMRITKSNIIIDLNQQIKSKILEYRNYLYWEYIAILSPFDNYDLQYWTNN